MAVGFIGTGSMGSMLVESLIEAQAVEQHDIVVINRTVTKSTALKDAFPKIKIAYTLKELVKRCNWLFICVKPKDMPNLFKELAPIVDTNQLAISITSPVSNADLDAALPCKSCRAIPSILNRAHSGSTLLSFGEKCGPKDQDNITQFISSISKPLHIEEQITRVSSDIVSCGPAFFSYLAQRFIEGAVNQTDITEEEATELTTSMLIGLGKLLEQEHYTLPTLQKRVCVPGGITGVGIDVLEQMVGSGFDELFKQTHKKYLDEKEKLTVEFSYK
ncbi:late competence protein ComER [Bacillus sp. JCM 19041]|uniref:late competence protein ComER n=1 Tax=Bacillus sp. JCM 19041 TaxID=1460637 RepID=UPI0006D0A505